MNVKSISPTSILLKLERTHQKKVPVRVELNGTPPEGYEITQVKVEPPAVMIKGARARLKTVSEIPTVPIDVTELRQSFQEEAQLEMGRPGVSLPEEAQTPKVTISIQAVSANFRIRNVGIRVLSKYRAKLSRSKATVLVRASEEDLKGLDQSKVFAQVDLRGKDKGKYLRQSIKVSLPDRIGLVKVVPSKVDVTLY